jgi:superfamily II DNA or RNA helicase/diadenosine tetraphosphate (Ap4A) HIT family hydrolase/HKD family nuclease/SOS-response transcriptional repressor LexA
MESAAPSPFLELPEAEWVCANDLCFALFDSYPVSPGHVLVITRRVVPTFFECTAAEQGALMALVGEVKALLDDRLDPKPDGYNVGFNAGAAAGQTVPHVHVHVIPRYTNDMADPRGGVRHVIPEKGNYLAGPPAAGAGDPRLSLTTGPGRPLWPRLAERLPGASEIDLLASFVQPSGLDIIRAGLFSAITAGARVRLLVGDYLGITSPEALKQLLGWIDMVGEKGGWLGGSATCLPPFSGSLQVRLAELENLRGSPDSFHPKAWRIADSSGGIVVVGSSNLSRAALETGVEWNLLGETSGSGDLDLELAAAFDDLWQQATPLSSAVVERYAARAAAAAEQRRAWDGEPAPAAAPAAPPITFTPRPWQQEALASLAAIRRDGYSKALVAVATGLGKTWLAAFDVIAVGCELGRSPRVLVIAHRAEILAQAEATLRQAIAPASVSSVAGSSCDLSGQLVIASIQKLSRPDSLAALAAAAPFDYCVVDEVHHAEAPSYRRVLARLSELSRAAPSFTLGLTATPERTDGVDVATLFDDILAAQATIGDGIAEGSLVPFRYRGLKDDVDYDAAKIPWRNGRFDPAVLEAALENAPRMERLWAEWKKGDGSGFPLGKSAPVPDLRRTLVFCCSRRHAVFARDWLRKRGVAAAAVFSDAAGPGGPVSDPRMASLAAFHAGTLSALCVVDLFNEGVDIPLVDRVVMLRPTESKIVFLQQLGRGLRAADGKLRLEVIDFVGNHRVFASRLVHLLSLAPAATAADATGFALLKRYLDGREPALPEGCVLDVELEAKELLSRFLPVSGTRVVQAYRDLRADLGRRPTMTELLHRGYNPRVLPSEFPTWFDFVATEGDATAAEAECLSQFHDWFVMLATTAMTKSFKMVLLRVLLDDGAFWGGMPIADSAVKAWTFLAGHPALRGELGDHDDKPSAATPPRGWVSNWRKFPISIWMKEKNGRRWFTDEGGRFGPGFACPDSLRDAFEVLTGELVDFRLAAHARPRTAANGFEAKVIQSRGKPFLKIPTAEDEPGRPTGPVPVVLPDGRTWEFRFARIACNVAGPPEERAGDTLPNHLPELLRQWFGPDAGLPGTSFKVSFCRDGDQWAVEPLTYSARAGAYAPSAAVPQPMGARAAEDRDPMPFVLVDSLPGGRKSATHVPVYDLTAAAGFWGPQSVPEEIGWTEVPGVSLKPGMFVARVTGTSMEPLIPNGSWCLFRPCPAGSREGRIVLVQLGTDGAGENGGRFTVKKYHSEKTVTADGWRHDRIQLLPVNPAFEAIDIEADYAGDLIAVAEFTRIIHPIHVINGRQ